VSQERGAMEADAVLVRGGGNTGLQQLIIVLSWLI
jgi:hypothetical protein